MPEFVRLLRLCSFILVFVTLRSTAFAASYYVDCSLATDGAGTLDGPWNNLATPSARTFVGGDVISLKRGTTCAGMLAPQGSGEAGAPISIDAYGTGARPIIAAGTSAAAIRLFNQSYWTIRNVETTGGNPHGIHISGNTAATLKYFRISSVSVHDVEGVATTKQSGLIEISPALDSATIIDDVIIDGATVFNTQQWMGIHVGCKNGIFPAPNSESIIIRNSRASNIAGDGITIYACSKGLIENNVSYDVGTASTAAVGLPNAIWTWACADCVVQFNEGYRSHSPGRDGGIFDIDFGSSNTTVQYNYGHDADGYCIAILGAFNLVTTNSIVRYNICSNNGRADPDFQGDIFFATWAGGSIDGVEIYNNTFFWNPAVPFAALFNRNASLVGNRPRFFKNNIIYSTGAPFITTEANLTLDNNLYWVISGTPRWEQGGGSWTSFSSFQSETGQEAQGLYADPLLASPTHPFEGRSISAFKLLPNSPAIDRGALISSMAGRDFFGVATPQGRNVDIGASEYEVATNLVVNPSFEMDLAATQTPHGWSTWSLAGHHNADYTETTGGAYSGSFHGTHGDQPSSYDVFTYQVLPDLPSDTYQLTAWVKSSGEQSVAWMEVNAYGGVKRTVSIPASSTWLKVSLTDIAVTAGQARIGFYSIANAGQWLYFDEVRFTRQLVNEPPPPEPPDNVATNLIVNPSFEMDLAATQTPYGWSTWSLAGHHYADYTEIYGGAYSGSFHGTHWAQSSSYDVFTYQVLHGLATETYHLTAWVKSSGEQSVAWLEVNAYGGAKRTVFIPASSTWVKVSLTDIAVTAGQARIGFYSIASAGQWLHFDEVSFTRRLADEPPPPGPPP